MSELADDDEDDKFLSSKVVKSMGVRVFALVVVKTTCTLFVSSFLVYLRLLFVVAVILLRNFTWDIHVFLRALRTHLWKLRP